MKTYASVDDYIAAAPGDIQPKLNAIRALIREVVPSAEERISYGIPYYNYKGHLVYFGLNKHHIGIYAIVKDVFKQFTEEIKPYMAAKGTIRINLDQDLPHDLLKRILQAQVIFNDTNNRNSRR